jgi:hypothetical protein
LELILPSEFAVPDAITVCPTAKSEIWASTFLLIFDVPEKKTIFDPLSLAFTVILELSTEMISPYTMPPTPLAFPFCTPVGRFPATAAEFEELFEVPYSIPP